MGRYYHLERKDKATNGYKFYRVFIEEFQVTLIGGLSGSSGQGHVLKARNLNDADSKAMKHINTKLGDGYEYSASGKTQHSTQALYQPVREKEIITPERRKEIDELIQASLKSTFKSIHRSLEEAHGPQAIVSFEGWSTWSPGWEWREELKAALLKKPHHYLDHNHTLVLLLDLNSVQEIRAKGITFKDQVSVTLEDQELGAGLVETTAKLWQPKNPQSVYWQLKDAFSAARALCD